MFLTDMADSGQTAANDVAEKGYEFENPFTLYHVQTHLILGPLSRHVKASTFVAVFSAAFLLYRLLTLDSILQFLWEALWLASLVNWLNHFTRKQQAMFLWWSMKVAGGMGAFIVMMAGSGSSLESNPLRALLFFLLGLIWIPGPEFIPRLTPHQKYITLARLGLSLLCLYVGLKTGAWF